MLFNRLPQLILIAIIAAGILLVAAQIRDVGSNITVTSGLIYYGIPALICLVAFIGLFVPPAARSYIFISGVSAAIAVLGADIYLALSTKADRVHRHEQYLKIWAERGIEYDDRGPLQLVDEERSKGRVIYPKLNPATLLKSRPGGKAVSELRLPPGRELMPLGTLSRMTSVYCNETGQYLIYKSDRHGFHNPDSVWDRKPLSIAAVGDSYTEGACVPSDRNFMALIRDTYPATLNLAMGGNGPLMELAALTEYLTPLRPRLVLWVYFEGNDMKDLNKNSGYGPLRRYVEDGYSQGLMQRQGEIDQALRRYFDENIKRYQRKQAEPRLKALDTALIRNVRQGVRKKLLPRYRRTDIRKHKLDLFRVIMEQARSRVENWGGKLVFVALASKSTIRDTADRPARLRLRRQVLGIVDEIGIPVINIAAAFDELGDPLNLYISRQIGHLNERGHKHVAALILKSIDRFLAHGVSGPPAPLMPPK